MPRKRIHELAKEWGVSSQAILAQLEKIGSTGKKTHSTVAEAEAAKVKERLGLTAAAAPVVGEDRLVSERVVSEGEAGPVPAVATREQVIERRVRADVIRRRTTRVEVPQQPPAEPGEKSGDVVPPLVESPAPPPPIAFEQVPTEAPAFSFALPVAEESPTTRTPSAHEQKEDARVAVPLEPFPAQTSVPVSQEGENGGAPAVPGRSPRILGRIDLRRGVPTSAPHKVRAPAPPAATPRPSRVLGRVDLRKAAAAPRPQPEPQRVPHQSRRKPVAGPVVARPQPAQRAGERVAVGQRPSTRHPSRTREIVPRREREEERIPRTPPKQEGASAREQQKTELTVPRPSKRVIRVAEVITVGELAKEMGVKTAEVIAKLMNLGVLATVNQVIDVDTATLAAAEFGYTVENVAFDAEELLADTDGQAQQVMVPRAPVVTVMGHVDHGKTSLLDAIRHTNVTAHEAGGITQHIGAYAVEVGGRKITFLDTPGHEAFTAMRARGARVTDIVVLVVAADDGVMPQTIEAINHARAAQVPFVVALTKIDKPEADVERVKKELAGYGVVPEEWGGDTIFVPVSAKTGEGISELLEMILLQAEILELKAPLSPRARGTVIEAKLDKGRGPVATVLVQAGVLKVGDPVVCGSQYGKVRALFDSRGQRITEAGPAMPVEVLGLNGVPVAGETLVVTRDEVQARQVAEHRQRKHREAALGTGKKFSLADLAQSGQQELRVVLKADVQGSVEALQEALQRLSTAEVKLTVLHAAVGGISESDVLLAAASKGIIIGFHVRPEAKAAKLAEREQVEIRLYDVIYEVLADVRAALEGLLAPTYRETPLGRVEVRQVFTIPRVGVIAGGMVTEGKITRGASVRLIRDRVVVYQGKVASLRRFKDDVREVTAGYECGVGLENFQDVKIGDVLEVFAVEQVARRLHAKPQEAEVRLSA